jgi:tetratricopeptide (TPR) repeat protein
MKANKFDEAVVVLDQLAEMQPDNARIYYSKAVALSRSSKLDEAAEAIAKAIEIEPDQVAFKDLQERIARLQASSEAERMRGAIAEIDKINQEGRYEEALQRIAQMEEQVLAEYKGVVWLVKARALRGLEREDEMIAAYTEAVRLSPEENNYGQEMVNYLLDKEKYEKAFTAYRQACEAASKPADQGLFDLGQNLVSKGKQEYARTAFEQVLEINPDYSEAYYELGMNYFYELDDRDRAKQMLQTYVERGQDEGHVSNAKSVLAVIAAQAG